MQQVLLQIPLLLLRYLGIGSATFGISGVRLLINIQLCAMIDFGEVVAVEFKKNDMIFTQDAMIGIEQSLKKCIFNRMRLQNRISHVDDVLIDLMR